MGQELNSEARSQSIRTTKPLALAGFVLSKWLVVVNGLVISHTQAYGTSEWLHGILWCELSLTMVQISLKCFAFF